MCALCIASHVVCVRHLSSPPPVPRVNSLDWRVDYLVASSFLNRADTNNIRLQLRVQPPAATTPSASLAAPATVPQPPPSALDSLLTSAAAPELLSFSLNANDFQTLYADLKQAKQVFAHL